MRGLLGRAAPRPHGAVSHVAPARELSTLVGAWIGSRMLREDSGPWRIVGAALIVSGVIALALRA